METEFADLIKSVRDDPTWFQARPDFFLGLLVRYSAILAFSIYFALYGESYWTRVVLSAVLMGRETGRGVRGSGEPCGIGRMWSGETGSGVPGSLCGEGFSPFFG